VGAQAFALHARTARQGYEGTADWRWIAEIKAAVSKPVVGNGDIRSPEDAARMLEETGCDGVMIGRAAIANPWILRAIGDYLRTGETLPPPTLPERVATARTHVCDLAETLGEQRAVVHLRGQLPQYFKGFRGASAARERLVRSNSIAEVETVFQEILASQIDSFANAPETSLAAV
jgi:tRNA-dihydrouridine synthase B